MEVEVKPYIENMDVIPSIISAHSAFLALDPSGLPATLSKPVLTDFLRGELGFQGVVTTDNMEMKGITKLYPIPEASWRAIAAGADLVLMKSEDAKTCEQTYESILNAVKSGNIPLERIEEANRRVLSLKMRYGLFDQPLVDASKASEPMKSKEIVEISEECIRQGIQKLKDEKGILPLKKDCKVLIVEQNFDNYLVQQHFDDYYRHAGMLMEEVLKHTGNITHVLVNWIPDEKDVERIKEKLNGTYDAAIVTSWSRRSRVSFNPVIQTIREKGIPVINLINSPYPHAVKTDADAIILSFQIRGFGVKALADVIFGEADAPGKWPLKLSFDDMVKR